MCNSNPASRQLIILGPRKILHQVVYFEWFNSLSASQYVQEWVHPVRNLSSHDKNCIKPTLGQFYFMQSFFSLCPSARWSAALQGAPATEGSLFHYKCPQTPHFVEKKRFSRQFWADYLSLSSLSNFSPKHIQTPSNTLNSHLFSTIFKVVFLHLIFLSLVPYLGFEVQECKCSFLTTIHTPFSLLLFLTFFCSIICFICFSQHALASQHVLIAFIACFLAYAMIYSFYVVGLAFLGQDMSTFHVCAQIHMILGSLP